MIIDNIVEIESPRFADAEYQPGNELIVFFRHKPEYVLIHDVTEREFLKLQNDPTDEAVVELCKSHGYRVFRR